MTLKILSDAMASVVVKKDGIINNINTNLKNLENELSILKTALEQRNDIIVKLEKKCRQLLDDKEKLRQRIMAMRMKNSANVSQKLCKNCSQEYTEAENFNWSCRTHRVPSLQLP